jgi:hypothetical protein
VLHAHAAKSRVFGRVKSCDVVHHVAGLDPSNLENAYERLDKVEGSEVYGAPGGNRGR